MKTRDSNQRCLASVPETIILNTVLATTYPNLSELHPVCACGLYSPFSSMDLQFPLKEQDLRNISKPPPKILTHSSVQFSLSDVSNSLRPHESQHARPPCPSPIPGVYSNPCPSSQWCHPTISSSVIPFSSCPQSLPASGSFPVSQLFASGDQCIEASASVLPMNIQDWFPLGLTSLISLVSKGFSRVFSNTTVIRHQFFAVQPFYSPITSVHDYWKNNSFD